MWYPDREEKLVPGELGTADISLYPLTLHVLSSLKDSMEKIGKEPRFVELHWRGGEQEVCVPVEQLKSLHVVNEVFEKKVEKHDNFSLFDSRKAPHYEPDSKDHGLFLQDLYIIIRKQIGG